MSEFWQHFFLPSHTTSHQQNNNRKKNIFLLTSDTSVTKSFDHFLPCSQIRSSEFSSKQFFSRFLCLSFFGDGCSRFFTCFVLFVIFQQEFWITVSDLRKIVIHGKQKKTWAFFFLLHFLFLGAEKMYFSAVATVVKTVKQICLFIFFLPCNALKDRVGSFGEKSEHKS